MVSSYHYTCIYFPDIRICSVSLIDLVSSTERQGQQTDLHGEDS